MKIGILQTGHSPDVLKDEIGDYNDMFVRLLGDRGFTFETYAVVDGAFPDGPEAAEGWLITGSRHGCYEDHPWLPPLEALIRDIVAAEKPLIGVCFGHQVIAQALGGTVEKYSGGWAVGRQEYDFGEGHKVALNAWHQDQVTRRPEGAEVIASTDHCANAALLYPGRAFTVQPHPEFGHDVVRGLLQTRAKGVVPDDLIAQATDALEKPVDQGRLADQFERFLKEKRL